MNARHPAVRGARPPVRYPDRVVWMDGRLLGGAEAAISIFDRGARDGEGLFETVRVSNRHPVRWTTHLERLVLSAAELGFPVPASPSELRTALAATLEANALTDAVARVTVTRGVPGSRPTRSGAWIEVEPLAARLWNAPSGVTAMVSRVAFTPGALGRHKTTSRLAYALAREEARAVGADEALLASAQGELLEGTVTNVFVVIGDACVTPPLASDILPGTTRAWALRAAAESGLAVAERTIAVRELATADELFLTNAIQGVVSVARLEGRAIPGRAVAARLAALHAQLIETDARARD
ncbi:MAG: 2-keto-4-methylthiobutyrate aminotransferase [Candidatus Eisenbacteria bacterium]|uniref:2-keto-4-methylthiobutyrate aminotransferase n=1 Tax=Eiseniibacteriota bacterium TaxID=2212470 RepID=A0A849SF04_UNCEI|nr:2-keto-4-methylthiobutyrate aminotransferase [Candidatus Eisenbacteria bacterium]